MDEYKEYLRFPDLEKSMEYTSILETNNIPFQLDDSSMRFNPYFSESPWNNQFILKIRSVDIEIVEKLFNPEIEKDVSNISRDHYLYTFSDNDILNIIENKKEWTKDEIELAIQIARERNINSSQSSIEVVENDHLERLRNKITLESPSQKPKKLKRAILLLILAFSSSVIYGMAEGYIKASNENQLQNSSNSQSHFNKQDVIIIIEAILFLGLSVLLLYKINKGKNWARTIYSFFTALGVSYFLLYIKYYFDQNITKAIFTSIETVLQIIALVLLYSREVNKWYDFKKIELQVLQK